MEAGEYELTRATCFVVRRLEVVAVAGLLRISWCELGAAGFRVFLRVFFFFSNAHCLLQVGGHLASFTSLLLIVEIKILWSDCDTEINQNNREFI